MQDDVPSFPDAEAFRIIEANLGRPMEEVFSAISEHPIAAASLGQVRMPASRSAWHSPMFVHCMARYALQTFCLKVAQHREAYLIQHS